MGDGADTITDASGVDAIIFDSSIDKTDITFSQSGNNLVLAIGTNGDEVTINNWFTAEENQIESFNFNGGFSLVSEFIPTILAGNGTIPSNLAPFVEDALVTGTEIESSIALNIQAPIDPENNTLTITATTIPSSTNGTIYLADGTTTVAVNDTLTVSELEGLIFEPVSGQAGTFTFSYSVNDGTSTVTADADITVTSSNPITGTSAAETLSGTTGSDYLQGLEGNDTLNGSTGDDVLIGGTGNDTLRGGNHNDTYLFSAGDGDDIVDESANQGNDSIIFDSTVSVNDIAYVRGGYQDRDLEIHNTSTGDVITVDDFFYPYQAYNVESIVFNDGTIHDQAHILTEVAQQTGTSGNDVIYGFHDYDDTLNAGAGADAVYGRNGNDHITGGTGNDTLRGEAGDDTYYFSAGDGDDIVDESANQGNDSIIFDSTVSVNDIAYVRGGYQDRDLEIHNTSTGDVITVDDFFYPYQAYNVESIVFNDGTIHDQAHILTEVAQQTGTSGNDVIYGFHDYDDTLNAGAGADTVYGRNGNDHITGGSGNDTLRGEAGDDTYYFSAGDGNDSIFESSGTDTIVFDNTVAASDILYERGGHNDYDLIINNTSTGETITVDNWFYSSAPQIIEAIQFDDGTVHDQAFVTNAVAQQTGTSGNDVIYGFHEYDDTINAGAGADTVYGRNGNDHITGGSGNDTLRGEAGDDTYYFSAGDGNDSIFESSGTDTIVFDNTISASEILYERGGSNDYDLIINNTSTGETITVDNWFYTSSPRIIEAIQFDDGTVHDQAFVTNAVGQQTGTSGNDVIYGFHEYGDTISGAEGNDTLYGNNDNDILVGNEGNDTLRGGNHDDYLQGDDGTDTLYGDAGNDTLVGGIGSDILYGGTGDDELYYDANDTTIDGDTGNDTLIIATNGSATSIDVGQSNLYQLEALDMRDGDTDDSIALDVADVLAVSDTNIFTIFGDVGDDVTTNDTWTRGSDTTMDGKAFATYTSSTASLNLMIGLNFNSVEVEVL